MLNLILISVFALALIIGSMWGRNYLLTGQYTIGSTWGYLNHPDSRDPWSKNDYSNAVIIDVRRGFFESWILIEVYQDFQAKRITMELPMTVSDASRRLARIAGTTNKN